MSYRFDPQPQAVNAGATNSVAFLVHLRFGFLEVFPAGMWQLDAMPGCVEEAQPVDSVLPFPSQMTSVGWRLSRLPLLPRGQLKGQGQGSHRQEMGEGWHSRALTAQPHRGGGEHFCPSWSVGRPWSSLEQSWLIFVEEHSEVLKSWNKLWQGLCLLLTVPAALGVILVPL